MKSMLSAKNERLCNIYNPTTPKKSVESVEDEVCAMLIRIVRVVHVSL
jgi:hypothetical protein